MFQIKVFYLFTINEIREIAFSYNLSLTRNFIRCYSSSKRLEIEKNVSNKSFLSIHD